MNELMNHTQFRAMLLKKLAKVTTKRIVLFRIFHMRKIQERLDAIERILRA